VKQLIACLLMLATLSAVAQTSKNQRAVHTQEKSANHVAAQTAAASLKVIYSNLGTATDLYNDTQGWEVDGFNSDGGVSDAFGVALPFTPKSDSHVSQVRVAVQYYGSGANQVNLSIYSDNNGIPGTLLAGPVTVKNLPDSGTCCTLAVASFTPLAVTGGTQYWVVADAPVSGEGSDFAGVWDWVSKKLIFGGTNGNSGWVASNAITLPAGEVRGTIP
jgi:hypothetical protein